MKNENRVCPACGGKAIKDYYRPLWICVAHDCERCDLVEDDFK